MEINKFYYTLVLVSLSQIGVIKAQNCVIGDYPSNVDIIDVSPPINEVTSPGQVIWVVPTQNIVRAVSANSPHTRYIEGFRYSTRYEYRASAVFSEFITNERQTLVERNTTFYCEDGKERHIFFRFLVVDQNTSPPEFMDVDEGIFLDVSKDSQTDGVPIETINNGSAIIVRDMDLSLVHAQVRVLSSRPSVFHADIERILDIDPITYGHLFKVRLQIVWAAAQIGTYSFELIADDNRFARNVNVTVVVLP